MKIYHDKSGRIIGICNDHIELGGTHVKLSDQKVPKDFLSDHLAGKYKISAGKLQKGKAQKVSATYFKAFNDAAEDRIRLLIGEDEWKKILKKREP